MSFKIGKVGALQLFQLFRQGSTILVAIFLVKIGLGTTSVGVYEKLLFIGFVLSFFWTIGLIQGILAQYPKKDASQQKQFFFNAYLFFLLISILIGLLCLGFRVPILNALIQQSQIPYYSLFIIYLTINLPTNLLEYFLFLKARYQLLVGYGIFIYGLQFLIMTLPFGLGYPFLYSFYGLIALAAVKHSLLLWFLNRESKWQVNFLQVQEWVSLSIPLILYSILAGATQAFDNWLVNYTYPGDESMFAIFRYGAREIPLAIILTSAFSNALIPEVAKDRHQGMQSIKEKSIRLMHQLFPISILLLLSSDWWFPLLFSAEYQDSIIIFNVLILITISRVIFPHTILIGIGKNKAIVWISVIEQSINVVSSLILVQFFGLWGIALGSLIAFSMEKVMQMLYLWKMDIRPEQYLPINWFLGYSVLMIVAYILIN